jgi:hypothetical protein
MPCGEVLQDCTIIRENRLIGPNSGAFIIKLKQQNTQVKLAEAYTGQEQSGSSRAFRQARQPEP